MINSDKLWSSFGVVQITRRDTTNSSTTTTARGWGWLVVASGDGDKNMEREKNHFPMLTERAWRHYGGQYVHTHHTYVRRRTTPPVRRRTTPPGQRPMNSLFLDPGRPTTGLRMIWSYHTTLPPAIIDASWTGCGMFYSSSSQQHRPWCIKSSMSSNDIRHIHSIPMSEEIMDDILDDMADFQQERCGG